MIQSQKLCMVTPSPVMGSAAQARECSGNLCFLGLEGAE